jgi:hypothetical protein
LSGSEQVIGCFSTILLIFFCDPFEEGYFFTKFSDIFFMTGMNFAEVFGVKIFAQHAVFSGEISCCV